MIKPGKYVILEHAFWSVEDATILVITRIEDNNLVWYFYEAEKNPKIRNRYVHDFDEIKLVPASSLILELL